MSSYIQGVTDYIPQIQEFTPDLGFYDKALSIRQTKFDAGVQKLSTLYGSLLNSPLSRQDTAEARDTYFKNVEQQIKKLSNVDFSIKSNVEEAEKLFDPIIDNNYIMKDIAYTKNFNRTMQGANNLKYCIDPEKCGGKYWDGGIEALMYQRKEFQDVSRDRMLGMKDAEFVAMQDIFGMAQQNAKEYPINMKVQHAQLYQGRYRVTQTNGDLALPGYQAAFTNLYSNDPKVQKYYQTLGYLERKRYGSSNADRFGGDSYSAELEYINATKQQIQSMLPDVEGLGYDVAERSNLEDELRNIMNSNLSEKDKQEILESYGKDYEEYKGLKDNLSLQQENVRFLDTTIEDVISQGSQIDKILGNIQLSKDINKAAQIEAYRNYSIEYDADEFALEDYKHQHDIALENLSHQHSLERELAKEARAKKVEEEENKNPFFNALNKTSNVREDQGASANPLVKGTRIFKAYGEAIKEARGMAVANEKGYVQGLFDVALSRESSDKMAKQTRINAAWKMSKEYMSSNEFKKLSTKDKKDKYDLIKRMTSDNTEVAQKAINTFMKTTNHAGSYSVVYREYDSKAKNTTNALVRDYNLSEPVAGDNGFRVNISSGISNYRQLNEGMAEVSKEHYNGLRSKLRETGYSDEDIELALKYYKQGNQYGVEKVLKESSFYTDNFGQLGFSDKRYEEGLSILNKEVNHRRFIMDSADKLTKGKSGEAFKTFMGSERSMPLNTNNATQMEMLGDFITDSFEYGQQKGINMFTNSDEMSIDETMNSLSDEGVKQRQKEAEHNLALLRNDKELMKQTTVSFKVSGDKILAEFTLPKLKEGQNYTDRSFTMVVPKSEAKGEYKKMLTGSTTWQKVQNEGSVEVTYHNATYNHKDPPRIEYKNGNYVQSGQFKAPKIVDGDFVYDDNGGIVLENKIYNNTIGTNDVEQTRKNMIATQRLMYSIMQGDEQAKKMYLFNMNQAYGR